ncbi:N-acetylneuraminate synthase [Vibrio nigripulchritudo]|uniref:N-acetylneuraminate synthase n=1 Tax=Vibrio nigripulchritudo TaxID=28173 RepID=UPI00190DE78C|nr:N-acetylneuraminate synthase [Vibrio nigripulchritudo]BCL71466.1 N-acetylneuraminate synthase [Vibrio nigripulchritudo]BDU32823.1 N-acetylneuraminate synthase [Vibrio nigripulchritudo]
MTLIIAEAGVNHNGDENLAIELVRQAKKAGADIVKFQTFKAKSGVSRSAEQADYQEKNTGKKESQLDMVSRLELSFEAHKLLVEECENLGIEFLSTAFDHESLEFLVYELGLKRLKIPSGEITNAPLVLAHARTGCDIILSTGMASLTDIETVLGIIAFGFTAPLDEEPTLEKFKSAYFSAEGQVALRNKVVVLHCTTEYPAPIKDINLKAMDTIADSFKLRVGYSDHSSGIAVSLAAAARGAEVIEKHFTLDKNMDGPDHKASIEPEELTSMVASIREINACLGDGLKGPRPSELKNMSIARKSIVAKDKILKGDKFSHQNLTIKRPGTGISPLRYWDLIGKTSKSEIRPDELVKVEDY